MMKKLLTLLLVLCLALGCLVACGNDTETAASESGTSAPTGQTSATEPAATEPSAPAEVIDYAGSVTLNMNSGTMKEEIDPKTGIKLFVDGDTTHFFVSSMPGGVIKGRYLAVNTPESTGKIEEYGKTAAKFTREKLETASAIVIESETATWDADSTGSRYLMWVWYKPEGSDTFRNLNIELLQNGLAIASNSAQNQYGETCVAALNQAKAMGLRVHGPKGQDPDFFYGEAAELTLKELRSNIDEYNGQKVAFSGVITVNDGGSVYIEEYDPETDMYYGITAYYGYNMVGQGLNVLSVGNEVRIVGSVQYYEAGGTYQISGMDYNPMRPTDPNNIQKLSEGHTPAFPVVPVDKFVNGEVVYMDDEGNETGREPYNAMALNTSIQLQGLKVVDTYTTRNEESASKGAFTLTCEVDGKRVDVRTTVLLDENGQLVQADTYLGKTISVKGIVDYYNGSYQVKVFSKDNIIVE